MKDERPTNHQDKRAEDIAKVMNAYNKATEERAFRARNTGTRAASIALSNPAAGAQLAAGRKDFENAPVDAITGGLKAGSDATKMEAGVSDLASSDEEKDPSSVVS